MRRTIIAIATAALAATASAQTLNVVSDNVTYAFPAEQIGQIVYSPEGTFNAMGCALPLAEISRIYIDDYNTAGNGVKVNYDGDTASVIIDGNIAKYVSAAVSGADVSILQSSEVADDTGGEITYTLSGNSSDGSFCLTGSYKASLELSGLTLTSAKGAPLDIQNGKRISLSVKKESVNTLTDAASGKQKGCILCKGHLELKGKGVLNIYGNTAHGIYAKEYVEMKNCTVNVLSAKKDGLNCNQYFMMESGVLNISGTEDDGVQVSYKDETDREDDDTGSITVADGAITIAITADASKGMKAEGNMLVSGGSLNISTSGRGVWDTEKQKTKASACLASDGNLVISGGALTLSSTGSGGKGINCDGNLTISGGELGITTTGGIFAYVNGTEYDGYTGNTDRLQSDQKSSPKGIKADGDILISGGVVKASTTGKGAEGIESKSTVTIENGTIDVLASDDAVNSSGDMVIKGGDICVVSTGNDGLDANGNMFIQGGTIRAFGARSPECGIDVNGEYGKYIVFTGGTLLAVGGGNSVPSTEESTQAYVSWSGTATAGTEVSVSEGDTVLAKFVIPDTYTSPQGGSSGPGCGHWGSGSGSNIVVTCAGLTDGASYTAKSGTSTTTTNARLKGSSGGGRPW